MIEYKSGNLFSESAEAIVNTVNCVGVMGRGIALQFKNAYPDNFKAYATACKREEVQPGQMFIFETGQLTYPRYIINFPTKRHWKGKSRIEDIQSGLNALKEDIQRLKIRSIAIPPLGSGLGGLKWDDVKSLIESSLSEIQGVNILVFEPNGAPSSNDMARNIDVPKMTPGRAALVGLVHKYLSGMLDPYVTLIEIHKLMYFLQASGEPLKLNYNKAAYGPYAVNLRHVLRTIEGHLISGYADGGDDPSKAIELVPGASKDAIEFLADKEETQERFDKVANLVDGFETPYGLELLSTVHWVIQQENSRTLDDVISRIYQWNDMKRKFTTRQIELAHHVLHKKGWLNGRIPT
ncbi:macro domain-containing protein [uncultured Thalassospira sp.]|uniref:type II toxin-antitoxin system antitoxin DNA ADP-ribosyl glycohydrolase DarG n=1 Tax=uncultured Thalassospira sp. TaxID=404382 RepID=UPI0030DA6D00